MPIYWKRKKKLVINNMYFDGKNIIKSKFILKKKRISNKCVD